MTNISITPREPTSLYEEHFDTLVSIGVNEFHIDQAVTELLADDVILSSLGKGSGIGDVRAWLITAMTWACRTYVERHPADVATEQA